MYSLINKVDAGKATYIEDFNNAADTISLKVSHGDIIIVFGAGNSHKLTKLIVQRLKNAES
jgi:UDP-N-acetylmuramate--alanine ligase